jgi:hypothetical protein
MSDLEIEFDRRNNLLCDLFHREARRDDWNVALMYHNKRFRKLREWWSAQPGSNPNDMRFVRSLSCNP